MHFVLVACLMLWLSAASRAANSLEGTYRVTGTRGEITLTLTAEGEKYTGTIIGAAVNWRLTGFPQKGQADNLLGTIRDQQDKFLSYFQVQKQGDKLLFDLVEAGPGGEPNFAKKSRMEFPAPNAGTATPETPTTATVPTGGDPYLGTFKESTKGDLTLTLNKQGPAYKGTLSGNGVTFQLEGYPENDGAIFGKVGNEQSDGAYFKVRRNGGQLLLDMIQPNGQGDPDFAQKRTVVFTAPRGAGNAPVDTPFVSASPAPDAAVSGASRYAGTFKNDEMTVESKNAGGQYSGTIKFGGQTFNFTGRENNGALAGVFQSKEDKFDFTASLAGSTLTLSTGGTDYALHKQNPNPLAKNPLAKPQPANPLARTAPNPLAGAGAKTASTGIVAPTTTGAPTAAWKTYKHPVGLSMKYPADWTLKEMEGFIQLVPPDAAATAEAAEIYVVSAQPAAGVTSPEDPRVIQLVEAFMAQNAPLLKRTGDIERISAGNEPGILLTWEGTSPQGLAMRGQIFGTILKGFAVSVLAIGTKERLAARDKTLRGVFTSLGAGAGERDPRLAGTWKSGVADNGRLIRGTGGRVQTTTASDSSSQYTLSADGAVTKVTHSRTIVNHPGVNLDTGDQYETKRGTWVAGEGKLMIFWEDGKSEAAPYQVDEQPGQPRVLIVDGQGFTQTAGPVLGGPIGEAPAGGEMTQEAGAVEEEEADEE